MHIGFVFPGQGSQKVGMGKAFYEKFDEVRRVYDTADNLLGFSIKSKCFEGPEDELNKTDITQPSIVVTSLAYYELLKKLGIKPSVCAGHSIGEYAALACAGVIDVEDAIMLAHKRGVLMQEACTKNEGTMAAVLGLTATDIEEVLNSIRGEEILQVANINAPDQVVISGSKNTLLKGMDLLKTKGAKRVIPLKVAGAFHSELMNEAAVKFALELDKVGFKAPKIPIVLNVTGKITDNAEEIKEIMKKQIVSSVKWVECVNTIKDAGINNFIEVGAANVLSGLIKKISPDSSIFNMNDYASIENIEKSLGISLLT